MPNFNEEFKFPDEIEVETKDSAGEKDDDFEIIIEDDTPPKDKGKEAIPKELVDKLDAADDEEELDEKAQALRLKQYKKVYHDERRAKEAAYREQQEAIELAKRVMEENKKLRAQYSAGEKTYIETVQSQADLQVQVAQRAYKEALESGDPDRIVAAQTELNDAGYKVQKAKDFKPSTLQAEENDVQIQQVEQQRPKIDQKTQSWLDQNPWYGTKKAMSSYAVGVHEELLDEYGQTVVGTDQYFKRIDRTMREKFPEYFDTMEDKAEPNEEVQKPAPKAKPSTVVAPATRSTASKQVRLKTSQQAIAKKLGLTPEQYARELMKLEAL
jgi:hypothetical protein